MTPENPDKHGLAELEPGERLAVGRSSGRCDLVIEHSSVSRVHAVIARNAGGELELSDSGSSLGTFVNGVRISRTTLKPGALVRFGNAPPYIFDGEALAEAPQAVGVSLDLERISIKLGGKTILKEASAQIHADEFVGVTGPSGSGKSTLLVGISGGYDLAGGHILFDGNRRLDLQREELEVVTGVVPQDNVVFPELTGRENLLFSARLHQPEASAETHGEMARNALEAVGMHEHADKRVCLLSGGQRKRINVAVSLLAKPRLLLLDEPTSGLDPAMEAEFFDKLRSLCQRGMTVVCVAHTRNHRYFDKLIHLAHRPDGGASVAYCGPPPEDPSVLETETTAPDSLSPATGSGGKAVLPRPPSKALRRKESGKTILLQAWTVFMRTLLCLWRDEAHPKSTAKNGPLGWLTGSALFKHQSALLVGLLPLLVGLLVVISQREQGKPVNLCFFLVISAYWFGMTSGAREIVRERKLYIRDKWSGLSPPSFIFGKVIYTSLISCLQAILLLVAAAFTGALLIKLHAGSSLNIIARVFETQDQQFSWQLFAFRGSTAFMPLACAAVAGGLTGLLISILSSSERSAVATMPLVLLPQILLSYVAVGAKSGGINNAPFGLILKMPESFTWNPAEPAFAAGILNHALYFLSALFPIRTTTMSMTLAMEKYPKVEHFAATATLEGFYTAFIVILLFLAASLAFLRRERKWTDWR